MNVVNIHVQYSGPCTLTVRSLYIWYASQKIMATFGTLFRNAFAVQLPPHIGRLLPQIGKLLPGIEAFFRRALGLNTHKFPKRGSLTDLPGLRLRLPELRLCLLSRVNNGKAEQQRKGFHKRASFLKTRTICHLCIYVMHWLEHMYPDPYYDVIKTSWKLQSLIPYHMLQFQM